MPDQRRIIPDQPMDEVARDLEESSAHGRSVLGSRRSNVVVTQDNEFLDRVREARDRLGEALGGLNEKMQDAEAYIRCGAKSADKVVRKTLADTEEQIHRRPFLSISIAFGVGLLTGLIVSKVKD